MKFAEVANKFGPRRKTYWRSIRINNSASRTRPRGFYHSLKYAFEKAYQPTINVFVHNMGDGNISVLYKDNGSGLSEDFILESTNSLGMLLIK